MDGEWQRQHLPVVDPGVLPFSLQNTYTIASTLQLQIASELRVPSRSSTRSRITQ
jgi:hypothetical protein